MLMFCLDFIIYKRGVVYHTAKRECIMALEVLFLEGNSQNSNVIFVVFLCL